MDPLTENIVVAAAELLALTLALIVVFWIGRIVLKLLAQSPGAERLEAGLRALRRTWRNLVLVAGFLLAVGLVGGNAWLIWKGEDLRTLHLEWLRAVPDDFWLALGVGAGKSLGLAIAVAFGLGLVRRALDAVCRGAVAFEGIRANDEAVEVFFASLTRVVRRATWLWVLSVACLWMRLGEGAEGAVHLVLRIYLTVAIGLVLWRAVDALIESIDALSEKYARTKDLLRYYDKLKPLMPALRRSVEWVIYVVVATLVIEQVGFVADLAEWGPRLVNVIGIAFLARVAISLANLALEELMLRRKELTRQQRQRRTTLVPLFRSVLQYTLYFTAAILILKELAFDPTPVLAGAGILALAVGLGAQNLVNDVVSGFFILFENHFLVGDFIRVGEAEGEVEAIELRTTRIRDTNGRLHIVRNGLIDQLMNYSKEYTFAVVEVGVAYESDLPRVFEALEEAGKRLDAAAPDVTSPTQVQGLEAFGESELTMRTVTRVKPGRHRQVQRDLRRIIFEIFDERGIEIPYARRVIIPRPEEPSDERDLSTSAA